MGDFDKTAVENLIKAHFGSIPAANSPRTRPEYDVPDHDGSVYAITTDKDATSTSVSYLEHFAVAQTRQSGLYRQDLVADLFSSMLSSRLAEIAQKPDAPFSPLRGGP